MNAEIITIGDEILIGQIVDTNSTFISKALNNIGLEIEQVSSIQDEAHRIKKTLSEATRRSDVIILTGGLGPTNDDVTKKVLCEYFDDELVENREVLEHIEWLFKNHIDADISDMNRQQALLPAKARALKNNIGTASGMWFEEQGKVVVSLPGVPYEMKALVENQVIPKLRKKFELPVIFHKTVLTYGLGESTVAQKIEAWENNLPNFIRLAYLPALGRVRLRLSARGESRGKLEEAIDGQIEQLHPLIGKYMHGIEGEGSLEQQIADKFLARGKTLALAESFTGGRIASRFTAIPGSSGYFKGGAVTYSTQSKREILGVKSETVDQFSVVSAEVAEEMAEGAREKFKSDFALSTTGNAGPGKGDSNAEVGTVFIALATPEKTMSQRYQLGNHREKITGKAVMKALMLLDGEL